MRERSTRRPLTAVVLVWVIVVSTIAPAAAGLSASAAGNDEESGGAAGNAPAGGVTVETSGNALEDKVRAESLVGRLPGESTRRETARETAVDLLDDQSGYYLGGRRDPSGDGVSRVTNLPLFADDRTAVDELSAFAGSDGARNASRAAALIVAADNESAGVAVRDARDAFRELSDRLEPDERRAIEQRIDDAETALARARSTATGIDATGAAAFDRRMRAIDEFASAWREAQVALNQLDVATTPQVVLRNRSDPLPGRQIVRVNGTDRDGIPVARATIRDAQPQSLENLTVFVNGTAVRTFAVGSRSGTAEGVSPLVSRLRLTVSNTDGTGTPTATLAPRANATGTVATPGTNVSIEVVADRSGGTGAGDNGTSPSPPVNVTLAATDSVSPPEIVPLSVRRQLDRCGLAAESVSRSTVETLTAAADADRVRVVDGPVNGNLEVDDGEAVFLRGAVNGGVRDGSGEGTLVACGARINGNLRVSTTVLEDTTVNGLVTADSVAGFGDVTLNGNLRGGDGGGANLTLADRSALRVSTASLAHFGARDGAALEVDGNLDCDTAVVADSATVEVAGRDSCSSNAGGSDGAGGETGGPSGTPADDTGERAPDVPDPAGGPSGTPADDTGERAPDVPDPAGRQLAECGIGSAALTNGTVASLSEAATANRTRVVDDTVNGDLSVDDGEAVFLEARVNGNVAGGNGSSVLVACGATVNGNTDVATVVASDTRFNGALRADHGAISVGNVRVNSNLAAGSGPVDTLSVARGSRLRVTGSADTTDVRLAGDATLRVNGNLACEGGRRASTASVTVHGADGCTAALDTGTGTDGAESRSGLPSVRRTSFAADVSVQTDTATLLLDSDGLPGTYERRVVGTDPLDPDSDSNRTAADEANDGTLDGAEDFDDDGLPTVFDPAPFDPDADGDGLRDGFEVRKSGTSPVVNDTDGDGVPDPAEQLDADGLNNSREQALGTHPRLNDTDFDGLRDDHELANGTDPLDPDTDGDGVPDGKEMRFGTDPTSADATGENGTYSFTASDDESGVNVTVRTSPENASATTIETVEPNATQEFRESSMVRIGSGGEFENATIDVPFDAAGATNASNYAVYTWEPGFNGTWKRVNSTVDLANGTATATVDSFSYFAVFNVANWQDVVSYERTIGEEEEQQSGVTPVDLTFIIDRSGSMRGYELRQAKDAATSFVGALRANDRAGLVGFASSAEIEQRLTSDFNAVNRSIEALEAGGVTNTGGGIRNAVETFEEDGDPDTPNEAILLSDGETNEGPDSVGEAREAAKQNITISTVAIGSGPDEDELQAIAEATGGDYYHVETAAELPEIFGRIGEEVDERTIVDSDGDGIPDVVENAPIRVAAGPDTGERIDLDPQSADTDGDGLTDSEEIDLDYTISQSDGETVVDVEVTAMRSEPDEADSDDDGLIDSRERNGWTISVLDTHDDAVAFSNAVGTDGGDPGQYVTERSVTSNPLIDNTDFDELDDGREAELGTDPQSRDTDTDGTDDGDEVDEGYDPTLFDITPPEIDVERAEYVTRTPKIPNPWNDEGRLISFYAVRGSTSDPSGVASATIIIDGREYEVDDPNYFDRDIDARFLGTIQEGLATTKLKVRATDEYGNSRTTLAAARSNGLVEAVKQSGSLDSLSTSQALTLGTATGISSGTGQLTGTVQKVVTQPQQTFNEVTDLSKYEKLAKNLEDVPGLLVQSYQRQQRTANPYYRGGEVANQELYEDFRKGYYAGLVVFEVAQSATTGQVKKIDKVQQLAKKSRVTSAVKYYRSTRAKYVTGPAALAGSRVTRRVASKVDVDASTTIRKTLSKTRTVGQTWSLSRRLGDTPSGILRGLSERGRAQLREYYRGLRGGGSGGDDTGLEPLTDGGQDRFVDTLEDLEDGGRTAATLQRRLDDEDFGTIFNADIPDETRETLLRAYEDGDLTAPDTAKAARKLDEPGNADVISTIRSLDDTEQRRALQLVTDAGDSGVRIVRDLDDDSLERLLRLEDRGDWAGINGRTFEGWELWRADIAGALGDTRVETDDVKAYLSDLDEIVTADRDGNVDVENYRALVDETSPNGDSFLNLANEADRTRAYVSGTSTFIPDGRTVDEIVVEPQFTTTNKDVDAKIGYDDSNADYVEYKRLSGSNLRQNLLDNVFTTTQGKSSVNRKFLEIGSEASDGNNVGEITVDLDRYDVASTDELEQIVLDTVEENLGLPSVDEISFSRLRVKTEDGGTVSIDLSEYE
ncbi:VWA domain-containing protein [Halosimplex pelagicum]|uniref:VWA domain-containing protein n=1 Tax=Halosimplex pelagicum TaxID=869886 RepID=A0A7D5TB14_9EURY|nr:VWA domain-containing protein [Halosimplex pelagicum]QLH80895.1 VWA domain-containing protein [Halosimplex pelagicum]